VDIKTLIELKSDKNAKFDSFVKVVDILKEKGHENFAIQTISE
jgi:tonB system transport protein exbD